MYCKNCGYTIGSGDKFCKNCGQEAKLDKFFILNQWLRNHRKWILVIIGIILVFIIISSQLSSKHTSYKNNMTQEDIALSIVNIFCSSKDDKIQSGGSGTMFIEDGSVLTNYHVVAKTDICLVTIPNATSGAPNEMYLANPLIVPKISEQYDIAFLKITGAYVDEEGNSYGIYPNTFKVFNDGEDCINYTPKLGEGIKIYGYPITSGGYNLTITDGIVSSFTDNGLILTSAKVDSGNSGGLAVNEDGCFIGIPSAVQTGNYQNLGVLIPANIILEFINQDSTQDTTQDTTVSNYCSSGVMLNGQCCETGLVCNDKCWKSCSSGQKWHCPAVGDSFCCSGVILNDNCCESGDICGGQCWASCSSSQKFYCTQEGKGLCCSLGTIYCNNQCWASCESGDFYCPPTGNAQCL